MTDPSKPTSTYYADEGERLQRRTAQQTNNLRGWKKLSAEHNVVTYATTMQTRKRELLRGAAVWFDVPFPECHVWLSLEAPRHPEWVPVVAIEKHVRTAGTWWLAWGEQQSFEFHERERTGLVGGCWSPWFNVARYYGGTSIRARSSGHEIGVAQGLELGDAPLGLAVALRDGNGAYRAGEVDVYLTVHR